MPVTVTIGGVPPTTEQQEAMRVALGLPEPFNLTDTKLVLVGSDRVVGIDSEDGDTPKLFTLNGIATFAGAAPDTVEGTMAAAETGADVFAAEGTVGGSSPEWVAAGTVYSGFNTTHSISVVAGGAVGHMLLVILHGAATISSIATNTSQSLTLLATHSAGGITGRLYGVVIAGSVPTSISVTLGALDTLEAQTFLADGVTTAGGIETDGYSASPITSYPYTSTETNSLVFAFLGHPSALNVATATFNGADAAFSITKWTSPDYISTFTGVHDGTVGAQTVPVTWGGGSSTDGRWMTVELVP